jgi:hypothetical protein
MLIEFASVESVSNANFGPLIAYLVPGATVLAGVSQFSPVLQAWFAAGTFAAPTLGGFLYLTVASIAVGMTVSAVRWAVLDTWHSLTGLSMPRLDFSRLGNNVQAYSLLIEIHYKHYLFYGNMFVATAIAYGCYRARLGDVWLPCWPDLVFAFVEAVFFLTSRDTLRKYYTRGRQLLGVPDQPDFIATAPDPEYRPLSRPPGPAEFPFQAVEEVHRADRQDLADGPQLD